MEHGPGVRVPEFDGPISSPAARRQQVAVHGAPAQGLDGGLVLAHDGPRRALARLRLAASRRVPEAEVVLVAAGRQRRAVGGPAQAADLLLVADERGRPVLPRPRVVLQDERVS